MHFPSTPTGIPNRTSSLNATQTKASTLPIFTAIEEELHDARRVASHGQEEDLRAALGMVIKRVGELSHLLSEAYKTQADLEVQLNMAKSNLQLVISNNEMLEDALSRGVGSVGWGRSSSSRRTSSATERPSFDNEQIHRPSSSVESVSSESSGPAPEPSSSRFFRFRFNNGGTTSATTSRPQTPQQSSPVVPFSSPSMPSLPVNQHPNQNARLEALEKELEKEREAHRKAMKDKAALEAEIENLSQALFEEANKMVATERIKRAETEEELKETRKEKEALKSALRVVEGENKDLRAATPSVSSFGSPVSPAESVGERLMPSLGRKPGEAAAAEKTTSEDEVASTLQASIVTSSEEEVATELVPEEKRLESPSSLKGVLSRSPSPSAPTSPANLTIRPPPVDDDEDPYWQDEEEKKELELDPWKTTSPQEKEKDPWKDPGQNHRVVEPSVTVLYTMR